MAQQLSKMDTFFQRSKVSEYLLVLTRNNSKIPMYRSYKVCSCKDWNRRKSNGNYATWKPWAKQSSRDKWPRPEPTSTRLSISFRATVLETGKFWKSILISFVLNWNTIFVRALYLRIGCYILLPQIIKVVYHKHSAKMYPELDAYFSRLGYDEHTV